MADAPWRCSACGTVNEPVANACRGCGRWPSLFDLEASTLDQPEAADVEEPAFERATYEPEPADLRGEPTIQHFDELEPVEPPPEPDAEDGPEAPTWRRILTSAIVPIAFVVYLLISIFSNDGG
jgi:hypothetical protein